MISSFTYSGCKNIIFGEGAFSSLPELIEKTGAKKAVLVCSHFFEEKANGLLKDIEQIVAVYSNVKPNPLLSGVEETVKLMREHGADCVVALGGGSAIDSAKFSAACAFSDHSAEEHFNDLPFPEKTAKIIAVPTTAGTGSEVTGVSVITHDGNKKSFHRDCFMPDACIVDPELTFSVPKKTTMITGIDAFTHALEAFWSVRHNDFCDLLAKESLKQIVPSLESAYQNGDRESRSKMAYGSLLAGLAFAQAKTAACHALSFALSMYCGLPHGEACAFTLDSFIELNNCERLEALSKELGFENTAALASRVREWKKLGGLCSKFSELDGETSDETIEKIAFEGSVHMLMKNNPIRFSKEELFEMLCKLK